MGLDMRLYVNIFEQHVSWVQHVDRNPTDLNLGKIFLICERPIHNVSQIMQVKQWSSQQVGPRFKAPTNVEAVVAAKAAVQDPLRTMGLVCFKGVIGYVTIFFKKKIDLIGLITILGLG